MRIVQATPEHLDLLTPLFVKYRELYDAMPYPETSRSFLEKRLTRKESVIYLALADDEDKLMGFCQLYPSFSSLSLKRVWILNDIYVCQDARRQLVADPDAELKVGQGRGPIAGLGFSVNEPVRGHQFLGAAFVAMSTSIRSNVSRLARAPAAAIAVQPASWVGASQ